MGDFGANGPIENLVNNVPSVEKSVPKPNEVWEKAKKMLEVEIEAGNLSVEEEANKLGRIADLKEKIQKYKDEAEAKYTSVTGTNERTINQQVLNDRRAAILTELKVLGNAPSARKKELEDELAGVYDKIADLLTPKGGITLDGGKPFISAEGTGLRKEIYEERERQAIRAAEREVQKKIEDERAAQALANLTKDAKDNAINWGASQGLDRIQ